MATIDTSLFPSATFKVDTGEAMPVTSRMNALRESQMKDISFRQAQQQEADNMLIQQAYNAPDPVNFLAQQGRGDLAIGLQDAQAKRQAAQLAQQSGQLEHQGKVRDFINQGLLAITNDPSDEHIMQWGNQAVSGGYLPADAVRNSVQGLLSVPVDQRANYIRSLGMTAQQQTEQQTAESTRTAPKPTQIDIGGSIKFIDMNPNSATYKQEVKSLTKTATPGQIITNERLTASGVNSANYPLLAQGIAEGRISPDRVNSRNATILEQALRLNPNADLNQLAGQGALARNPAFQQKAMAVESIPEVIKSVAEAGKKLNFSDNVKAIADMQKWYAGQTQDPKLTEYMTLRNDSLMSIAYAMRQAGMSDYATRMEAEAASPSMSPAQLDAWVNAQMKALEPRLKQYRSVSVTGGNATPPPAGAGAGAGAGANDLTPAEQAELAKLRKQTAK